MPSKPKSPKPVVKVEKTRTGEVSVSGTSAGRRALAVRPPPTPALLDARQDATKTRRKASGPPRKAAAVSKIKAPVVPPVKIRLK